MPAPTTKKTIAIFFGGCSTEYEVSLQSACSVIQSIDTTRFTPILIGIDRKSGQWYLYHGTTAQIENDTWQSAELCTPIYPSVNRDTHGICYLKDGIQKTISLDAALPILHGKNGEDGTLQGLLDLMRVRIIGCGTLSSALCMDKELAHRIVSMNGIKSARYVSLKKGYSPQEIKSCAQELGYPLFVKPVRSGSSFGISKVLKEEDLLPAIEEAFHHDSTVLLEELIDGFEVGCAVLGTKELLVGEVDEIELSDGFFDFTEKYTLKTSSIHVPARITPEQSECIKNAARTIYRVLGCAYFARVDLFLTPKGEIYFNEVNTIPGVTSHSRYPNMLKAAGLPFDEVINRLLEMEG